MCIISQLVTFYILAVFMEKFAVKHPISLCVGGKDIFCFKQQFKHHKVSNATLQVEIHEVQPSKCFLITKKKQLFCEAAPSILPGFYISMVPF